MSEAQDTLRRLAEEIVAEGKEAREELKFLPTPADLPAMTKRERVAEGYLALAGEAERLRSLNLDLARGHDEVEAVLGRYKAALQEKADEPCAYKVAEEYPQCPEGQPRVWCASCWARGVLEGGPE